MPLTVPPDTLPVEESNCHSRAGLCRWMPKYLSFWILNFFQMLIRAKPKTFWRSPHIKEKYNANIKHSIFTVYVSCFMCSKIFNFSCSPDTYWLVLGRISTIMAEWIQRIVQWVFLDWKSLWKFTTSISECLWLGGDCSHEIKRCLLLGRKVMTNWDSILKSRDITLPTRVHLLKAMVFPIVMYGCES